MRPNRPEPRERSSRSSAGRHPADGEYSGEQARPQGRSGQAQPEGRSGQARRRDRGLAAVRRPVDTTRMFAAVVPGLAPLVARDLERLPGVQVTSSGFDGRSDLILLDVARRHQAGLWSLRTIEDLFVEVGRTTRAGGDQPHGIAERVWRRDRLEKPLSIWSARLGPLAGAMSYRVIARVLQERSFLRTELRRAMTQAIAQGRPRWKVADPARIEVWISEYRPGYLVAGLRLSDGAMRQHQGREVERHGALRPTVAAMMVGLAGEPHGPLLDPCCGSGTILSEALAAGWPQVRGRDIDPGAVTAARANVPSAELAASDVRTIDLATASAGAVVSNLPFGRQYELAGTASGWLAAALAEIGRVTRPGGRVILLVPEIPDATVPDTLRITDRTPLWLLGMKTTLWIFHRV